MTEHNVINEYQDIILELGLPEEEVLLRLDDPYYPEILDNRICCWHTYLSPHVKMNWLDYQIVKRLKLMLYAEREARRYRSDCCFQEPLKPINESCKICRRKEKVRSIESGQSVVSPETGNTIQLLNKAFYGNLRGLLKACNAMIMPISYIDQYERYWYVNKAYRSKFGMSSSQIIGRTVVEVVGESVHRATNSHVRKCLNGETLTYLQKRVMADGEIADFEILTIPHYNDENEIIGAFGILSEHGIIDSQYYARHDILTKLGNRYELYEKIKYYQELKQADFNAYLVVFDLNRFRSVNDSLGHEAGDYVLQVMANRLTDVVDQPGEVFRLGGDEFGFIHKGVSMSCKDSKALVKVLNAKIVQPIYTAGREITLDATFGIAEIKPTLNTDPARVVYEADAAMAYSEKAHEVCLCYCDEMHDESSSQSELEIIFKWYLRNEKIIAYFQPILDTSGKDIMGYEALARWFKTDGRMVSPAEFIPIAESAGLMADLTNQVLCRSVDSINLINAQRAAHEKPLYVSVNISPSSLNDDWLVRKLDLMLKHKVITPECIRLEITEELSFQPDSNAMQRVREIRKMGIKIACDDFGTGYSSLSQLGEMPWDILKIDRSFLVQERAKLMLEPIVQIAKKLGIPLVMEGVEDEGQEEFVKALGCEYVQGFYYGKPSPIEAILS